MQPGACVLLCALMTQALPAVAVCCAGIMRPSVRALSVAFSHQPLTLHVTHAANNTV